MTKILVEDRSGTRRAIEATNGVNLMEAIRDNGFDDLQALCGGCASCATCHVHVIDDAYLSKLAPMDEIESELLDMSPHRRANSRLSCQIVVSGDLDGMSLVIAESD